MFRKLLLAVAIVPIAAHGAVMNECEDVRCGAPPHASTITVDGDFAAGDADYFRKMLRLTSRNNPIIVIFDHNHGGLLKEGIDIGTAIREAQANTVVTNYCYSACALAWLGGVSKGIGPGAQIGFHAAYNIDTNQVAAPANAVIGYYIARMGLSLDVAAWATSAAPDQINLMTPAIAKQLHVSIVTG